MTKKEPSYSFEDHVQQTLKNINVFLRGEGLKRKRLAQKLGMSESNFSDYLQGKRSNVLEFSARLEEVLGLEGNYFADPDFAYRSAESKQEQQAMIISKGNLSPEGEEGLHQLLRISELVETYDVEDHSDA
ncbi:helix-turn-helix transcriptional regulator [Siminovitchia fortis]|uniref:XRE family transcriptional regulator n=1 Tax=Siminovitchia fortis TaxID=254758 RepID=A0A443IUZ8_9BACI|nr:helix-turn-helix transcriptional regulator [Siminovitchia fortis]RWR11900.1 XRE family transcriptional regulator [Siminovitchia fortis]WHY81816.1 helix-turn-helix transcriptional regulator [Siminovitchia fortis]